MGTLPHPTHPRKHGDATHVLGVDDGLLETWVASPCFPFYSDLGQVATVADYGLETATMPPSSAPTSSTSSVLVSKMEYDGYGRIEKATDSGGKVTRTFYDSAGRKEYVVENYSTSGWDNSGEGPGDGLASRSSFTDKATNRITQYAYNTAGRLTSIKAVDPAYDGDGTTTDDQTTSYAYSDGSTSSQCVVPRKDLLVTITHPGSDTDTLTYHPDGTLASRTDQNGTKHEYVYDDLRRLTEDKVTTFSASADVDETVKMIKRTYDDNGRLSKITSYSDTTGTTAVNDIALTYANGFGLLTKSEQDHDGLVHTGSVAVQYAYAMTAATNVITHAGRLTDVTYPKSASLTERKVYYNLPGSGLGAGIDRLDNIASAASSGTEYAQFTYMGAGSIVKEHHEEVTNDGLTLDYDVDDDGKYAGLDDFGRVVDQKWSCDTTVKDHFSYGYDTSSNRLWRKNEVARNLNPAKQFDEVYHDNEYADAYDGLDRLRHFRRGLISLDGTENDIDDGDDLDRRERWTLDGVGNWNQIDVNANGGQFWTFAEARTHNTSNEITNVSDGSFITPEYDDNGNMTSGCKPGVVATVRHYRYDAWNRLVVVYVDGDSDDEWDGETTDTLVEQYEYDGLHRRIVKIVPNATTSTKRDRTDYYYNASWQVLEEKYKDDLTTEAAESEMTLARCQYIWSPRYIDSPILRDVDADGDGDCTEGSGGSARLYYMTDANHNVTGLVETDGDVVERYVYNPYGEATVFSDEWATEVTTWSSSQANEIRYCGYRYSDGSRLHQSRYRWYDYAHGRWLTPDPLNDSIPGGGFHDGVNLYEYVRSEPIAGGDPSGLAPPSEQMATPEKLKAMQEKLKVDMRKYAAKSATQPAVRRAAAPSFTDSWYKIGEFHYLALRDDADLRLLSRVSERTGDNCWRCLLPIEVGTPVSSMARSRYRRGKAECGDVYSVEPLTRTRGKVLRSVSAIIGGPTVKERGMYEAEQKMSGWPGVRVLKGKVNLVQMIRDRSGQGKTPLDELSVHGHCWHNSSTLYEMAGGKGDRFGWDALEKVAEHKTRTPSLLKAVEGKFPPPCWLKQDVTVTLSGCYTKGAAEVFARKVWTGGSVWGTTKQFMILEVKGPKRFKFVTSTELTAIKFRQLRNRGWLPPGNTWEEMMKKVTEKEKGAWKQYAGKY